MGTKPLYHCKLNGQKELSKGKQRVYRTSIKTLRQQSRDFFHFHTHCISPLRHTCSVWRLTLLYFQSWTIRPVSKIRKNRQCLFKDFSVLDTLCKALHVKTTLPIKGLATLPLNSFRMTHKNGQQHQVPWETPPKMWQRTGLNSLDHITTYVCSGSFYAGFNF